VLQLVDTLCSETLAADHIFVEYVSAALLNFGKDFNHWR
jgi:hypothetical protein